jgi:hypothetical protein
MIKAAVLSRAAGFSISIAAQIQVPGSENC